MKALFFLLALAFSSAPAHAGAFEYIGRDLASPVTTDAVYPLLVGGGLTLALFATKSEISHPLQETITRDRPFDRYAKLGDWTGKMYPNMIYTGAALISAAFGHKRGLVRAEEMALASVYSGLVTSLLKVTFREGRPNNPADKKSFPSGHSTTAFAFAAVVGAEHPLWLGIPAYILAVNSGYSRINDNKHYLHDVIGGATIGVSYALGIYYIRKRREAAQASGKEMGPVPLVALMPAPDLRGGGLAGMIAF